MLKLNSIERIITHSGVFHTDEVFCVALVESLKSSEVEIVRTRDEKENFKLTSTDLVVDVWNGKFDHHSEPKIENGRKLSSFGLLYKAYKKEVAEFLKVRQKDMSYLDKVVCEIDAYDHGENRKWNTDLNAIIKTFNNSNIGLNDTNFRTAVDFTKVYLKQVFEEVKITSLQNKIWEEKQIKNNIIILNGFVRDWKYRLQKEELTHIEYVFTLESWAHQYSVQRTRDDIKNLNETLESVEGVKFAHPTGFIAKIEIESLSDIIKILENKK